MYTLDFASRSDSPDFSWKTLDGWRQVTVSPKRNGRDPDRLESGSSIPFSWLEGGVRSFSPRGLTRDVRHDDGRCASDSARSRPVAPRARGAASKRRATCWARVLGMGESEDARLWNPRRASVTASASRPLRIPPVPSGDGTVVPDAFRFHVSSRVEEARHVRRARRRRRRARWIPPPIRRNGRSEERHPRGVPGPMPGAYSAFGGADGVPDCEPCPCEQFENAFEATEQWTADRAVLPVRELPWWLHPP